MSEDRSDGRRARGHRSREVVIDALLALTAENGRVPPPADVAARAGVSLRSVYLYLADTNFMSQLISRSAEKDVALFEVPDLGSGPLALRIDRLVSVRVNAIANTMRLIQASIALFDMYPAVRDNFDRQRSLLRMQTQQQFSIELDQFEDPLATQLLDAVDGLTQIETVRYYLDGLGRTRADTIVMLSAALHRILRM